MSVHRRRFLGAALGLGAGLTILPRASSAWGYAANEKVGIALVGVGGRGRWFVQAIPGLGETFVALCDVNDRKAAEAYGRFPDVRKFHDYRKMLEEMEREIDAVIVATPDHIHAPCSSFAMKMGKHVYCEKPLTHDVREARALRETARATGVATQMGNQGTASEPFRRALELIRAGVIGEVREVHVWNTNGGPGSRPLPRGVEPKPDFLQWDLWLGPVPYRSFHSRWLEWHGWREFGTGQLGNWACHTANLAFTALDVASLFRPDPERRESPRIRVHGEASEIDRESFPRWEVVRFDVPARGAHPPLTLRWYNGSGKAPRGRELFEELCGRKLDWGDAGEKRWADHAGCVLVGSKGNLHSTGHNASFTLLPEGRFPDEDLPPRTVPRSRGHEREWLDACRGGPPAMSRFERSGPLAELVLLGNVATQLEGPFEFDPIGCRIEGNDEADRALGREHRKGWEV